MKKHITKTNRKSSADAEAEAVANAIREYCRCGISGVKNRDEFLTTNEAAARLKICKRTLHYWAAHGKLPYIKLRRRVLFHWPSTRAALLRMQIGGGQ